MLPTYRYRYASREAIKYIDEVLAKPLNVTDPFFQIGELRGALEVLKIQLSVAEEFDPIGPAPAMVPPEEPF